MLEGFPNWQKFGNRRRDSDLSGPVAAALSGTPGFALDPTDLATMWTTSAKVTQVSVANDPIGAIVSKWGAAPYDIIQASGGSRPLWNGLNAADFDGTDDHWLADSAEALLRNKPAGFWCGRICSDTLAAQQAIIALSGATGTSARFRLLVTTTGALALTIRRVDGGSQTAATSAAGVIVAGVPCVLTMDCDYAGTRAIRVFKDGVSVISTTLVETAGNTSDTNSTNFWVGRNISALEYLNGRLGRMVFADKLMTAGEIASIEGWVGEGALT